MIRSVFVSDHGCRNFWMDLCESAYSPKGLNTVYMKWYVYTCHCCNYSVEDQKNTIPSTHAIVLVITVANVHFDDKKNTFSSTAEKSSSVLSNTVSVSHT
jgi:hypothetical protein